MALVLATGGTSYAVVITGKQIKDGSLSGADVKNSSLSPADLDATALKSLQGSKGISGDRGTKGPKGLPGPTGPKGLPGDPANVSQTWAWWDSGFFTQGDNDPDGAAGDNPNTGSATWFDYNTGAGIDDGNQSPSKLQFVRQLGQTPTVAMELSDPGCGGGDTQGVECPFGASNAPKVTTQWSSNITATATLTLMYRTEEDTNGTPLEDGTGPFNTRADCFLEMNGGSTNADYTRMGARTMVSADRQRMVQTVTVVGSDNRSKADDYLVRVMCEDADHSFARERWYVVNGSLSVVATQRD